MGASSASLSHSASQPDMAAAPASAVPETVHATLTRAAPPKRRPQARRAGSVPSAAATKAAVPAATKATSAGVPSPRKAGSGGVKAGQELVGRAVVIDGLAAKPQLNGTTGTATSFDDAKGRYNVKLDTPCEGMSTLALKPSNLTAKA